MDMDAVSKRVHAPSRVGVSSLQDVYSERYQEATITTTKKIALLFTGGTFLCTQNMHDGSHEVTDTASQKHIYETANYFPKGLLYEVHRPYNIDSSDLIPGNRSLLVELIRQLEQKTGEDEIGGYVIVHGTDTMEYTAAVLSFMVQGVKKPIILTGSMKSISDPAGDAPGNIQKAILAAQTDLQGCYVAFGDKLLQGNKVKKTDTNDVNTFSTLNYPPVGIFAPQQTYREHEQSYMLSLDTIIHRKINTLIAQQPEHIATTLETEIAHIMLTPFTDWSILDWYREKGIKAIIIEGFGDGNVPSYTEVSCTDNESRDLHKQQYMRAKLFHERIKRCIDAGIIVVLGSQCHTGVVDHKYTGGQQMLGWGALSADQHTLPAIRGKLAYLLKHSDNIPRDFTKNISGELL